MTSSPAIAIVWMRFGPYHLARLRAAAERFRGDGIAVHGIEIARTDGDYAWDVAEGAEGFRRHTVFSDGDYSKLNPRAIATETAAVLARIAPRAVAINGWGVPEARAALKWCRRNDSLAVLMSETMRSGRARNPLKEAAKSLVVRRYDAALVGGTPHREYVRSLGVPEDRIFFGYDAVDNDFFARGAAAAREGDAVLRRELSLPARYFLCNTRFLPRKNIDGLLRAYALYRRNATDAPWGLVVSGSGETEPELRALEASLQLEGVTWPGFLQYDRLPVYYGLASAFVHPAKAEAWGLVLNEAAAAGLPVLSSMNVGAAHELLHHGENGFAFDPADDQSIARALTDVANLGGPQRAALGEASRRIVADWSPARFASGLADAVNSAERARAARPA